MLDGIGRDKVDRVQWSHVRNAQEGKKFTVGDLQLTLKATGAETEDRFALVEVTLPPYSTGIWPHYHQQATEAIYITQGLLAATLGEETMVLRQGSFILIYPHQVHRFWNPTANPTTFLAYFAPAGIEEFFEALSEMELAAHPQLPSKLADIVALGISHDHFFTTPDASASDISASDISGSGAST